MQEELLTFYSAAVLVNHKELDISKWLAERILNVPDTKN